MVSLRRLAALAVLFMLVSIPAPAQSQGEFEYYYSARSVDRESHAIFKEVSNVRLDVRTQGEVNISLMFNRRYDSLFEYQPEVFYWTVINAPEGSYFDKTLREFFWAPSTDQNGDRLVKIAVRAGDVSDTAYLALRVEESWKSSLIPGMSYSVYAPVNAAELGVFHGASIEYLLVSWVARNNNRGPSHGRVFVKFDLLHSSDPDVSESFFYTTGLHLSMERNPRRSFLIPYFGVEFGGMYNKQLGDVFHFTPLGGVWLYSDRMNSVNATVGYLYPGTRFEELRGWRASLGGTFSLW